MSADDLTDDDRARIAARYPRRRSTDLLIGGVAVLVLVVAVGLVLYSGLMRSNPPVSAMVRSFETTVESTTAEIVVQRGEPSQAAACFVYVQAANYERVGELDLEVPPGDEELTTLDVEIRTVREGTAVSVENCRIVD